MAYYAERGLALTFSGDLQLSANGDIALASSYETQKSAVNWFLRTNKGDYKPDARLGCDLGKNIGDRMTEQNLNTMEDAALMNLTKYVMPQEDLRIDVIPVEHETVGVFASIRGKYLDPDGNVLDPGVEVITYVYPYFEGQPTPLAQ
jgi:hypothetical protein